MKFFTFFLPPMLLFAFGFSAQGQVLPKEQKILKVLVFEHLQKDKKKLISQGAVIRYKLQSNPKIWYKGLLEDIGEDQMTVAGKQVRYEDCLLIAGRVHSERGLLGGVALGAGTTTLLVGSAALGTSALGIGLLSGGIALVIAGIILVTRSQRFHFEKGWSVYGGTLSYDVAP